MFFTSSILTLFLFPLINLVFCQTQFQYQLHDADTSILIGADDSCLAAYNANVTCPSIIGYLYGDNFPDLDTSDLTALCTGNCFSSLTSHRASVAAACNSSVEYYNDADQSYWPATYLDDVSLYLYNMTCLLKPGGQLCNTWFQSIENTTSVNSTNCDPCILELALLRANAPVEADASDYSSMYTSLSASCGYTGPPATPVTTLLISSPTATSSCVATYTIQPSDTYFGVAQSQRMSTNDMLSINGLTFNQTAFSAAVTLCIKDQCTVYVVRANDTCNGIQTSQNITWTQLTSWNPQINGLCSNLGDMVNQTLCLTNPLGNYVATNVSGAAPGIYTTPAPVPTGLAPNSSSDCGLYYTVQTGDTCSSLSLKFDISLTDFYFLNPELNANCTNLWLGSTYCVAPVGTISTYPGYGPTSTTFSFNQVNGTSLAWSNPMPTGNSSNVITIPIANGTRVDCWTYIWLNSTISANLSCWDIAMFGGLTPDQFILWNPSLDQNSPNATTSIYNYSCTPSPSSSYCIGLASPTIKPAPTLVPPSPRGEGEIAGCLAWTQAQSGYDCGSMLSNLRLTLSQFYQMNPSVESDCSDITPGTYYCISTGTTGLGNNTALPPNATTSSTTSSTSSVTTPTPTQTGMVSNCVSFHYVVSGDTCYAIAQNAGITLSQFYAWNPAVQSDCSLLFLNYYVCTGIQGSSSSSTTIASSTSASSSTTSSSSASSSATVSPNGVCGGSTGYTCQGSTFGSCCSSSGFCGSTSAYCGSGCQTAFGTCSSVSTDGTCGSTNGWTCSGSSFGNCCSSSGYCGSSTAYCGTGCQTAFGTCLISPDGTCGGTNGYICSGSSFGNCCSSSGYCGNSSAYCGGGCQSTFGACSGSTSSDGTCGGTNGYTCSGSSFGNCCSSSGYCGSSTAYCGTGCQTTFGTCT